MNAYSKILSHSWEAYKNNLPVLLPFLLALLVSFPLALIMPNYVASSGIFLRYASMQQDLNWIAIGLTTAAFALSLLLFTFAIVAINVNSKSHRTLTRLKTWEFDALEEKVARLFIIFLLFFALSFFLNILMFELNLHYTWGLLISLLISTAILFTPQAIVLDELSIMNSIKRSISVAFERKGMLLFFFAVSMALILINTGIFVLLQGVLPHSRFFAVAVNALLVIPFLEILKTQIYLSKYTLI